MDTDVIAKLKSLNASNWLSFCSRSLDPALTMEWCLAVILFHRTDPLYVIDCFIKRVLNLLLLVVLTQPTFFSLCKLGWPFAGIHVLYMLTLFNRLIRNCTKSCNRLLNLLSWQPWLFTVSSDMKISFWWNWFIFFSNSLHSVWLCGAWRQCLTSTTTTTSPTCILYTAGVVLPQ